MDTVKIVFYARLFFMANIMLYHAVPITMLDAANSS